LLTWEELTNGLGKYLGKFLGFFVNRAPGHCKLCDDHWTLCCCNCDVLL